jgi:hypothetical protein
MVHRVVQLLPQTLHVPVYELLPSPYQKFSPSWNILHRQLASPLITHLLFTSHNHPFDHLPSQLHVRGKDETKAAGQAPTDTNPSHGGDGCMIYPLELTHIP